MAITRTVALVAILQSAAGMRSATGGDAYTAALAEVEDAMVEVNTDPEHGIEALRAALAALHDHAPALAADPAALERRTLAELALARALLASDDPAAAAATVDATLESLAGAPLPTDQLGPSLAALVDERALALADRGSARLHVRCSVPCRVYVDERETEAETVTLPVGEHRIWIEGDDAAPLRTTLTLAEPDAALSLAYPAVPAPTLAPASIEPSARSTAEASRTRSRTAPRWAEVTTLVLGAAAVAAGAALWVIDDTCLGGGDPRDVAACPDLYDTRTAGIALVSAGAAAALTGGVLLTVDETRLGDRRGHELALTWTTRF